MLGKSSPNCQLSESWLSEVLDEPRWPPVAARRAAAGKTRFEPRNSDSLSNPSAACSPRSRLSPRRHRMSSQCCLTSMIPFCMSRWTSLRLTYRSSCSKLWRVTSTLPPCVWAPLAFRRLRCSSGRVTASENLLELACSTTARCPDGESCPAAHQLRGCPAAGALYHAVVLACVCCCVRLARCQGSRRALRILPAGATQYRVLAPRRGAARHQASLPLTDSR